jgi:hypothetical protein
LASWFNSSVDGVCFWSDDVINMRIPRGCHLGSRWSSSKRNRNSAILTHPSHATTEPASALHHAASRPRRSIAHVMTAFTLAALSSTDAAQSEERRARASRALFGIQGGELSSSSNDALGLGLDACVMNPLPACSAAMKTTRLVTGEMGALAGVHQLTVASHQPLFDLFEDVVRGAAEVAAVPGPPSAAAAAAPSGPILSSVAAVENAPVAPIVPADGVQPMDIDGEEVMAPLVPVKVESDAIAMDRDSEVADGDAQLLLRLQPDPARGDRMVDISEAEFGSPPSVPTPEEAELHSDVCIHPALPLRPPPPPADDAMVDVHPISDVPSAKLRRIATRCNTARSRLRTALSFG